MVAISGAGSGRGGALTLVLSPEGGFVRQILVDELSKGLDAAWRLAFDSAVDTAKHQLQGGLLLQLPLLGRPAPEPAAAASGPGMQLVQSLVSLPQLADDDDREQVDGIMRLASAMYGLAGQQGGGSSNGSSGSSSSAVAAVEQGAALLRWLAGELQALPPAAQQQALLIPVEIASKLTSRLTARLIKVLLTGGVRAAAQAGGARSSGGSRSVAAMAVVEPQQQV